MNPQDLEPIRHLAYYKDYLVCKLSLNGYAVTATEKVNHNDAETISAQELIDSCGVDQ